MIKSILYVGGFNFTKSNASAVRVIENARFFEKIGFNVTIMGKTGVETSKKPLKMKGISIYDISSSGEDFSLNINSIELFVENSLEKIDYIIAYNYPPISFSKLINYTKNHKIILIPDITEWYGIDGNFTLMKGLRLLLHEWRMRVLNRKVNNILVASSYLSETYKSKNTFIFPFVTIDSSSVVPSKNINTKELQFVFAGSPGKNFSKDRLDIIIEAFARQKDINFKLHIVGLKYQWLLDNKITSTFVRQLGDKILCYGRLPNEECIHIIKKSDFVIFARQQTRVTRAGFPTKVFEAFKYGLPVITNSTSDISEFINDKNGFLVPECSTEAFSLVIRDILNTDVKILNNIIENTRLDNPFYYRNFEDKMKAFFNTIQQ
jgi:glycosyltransferase involved in cell wall biosynthesis